MKKILDLVLDADINHDKISQTTSRLLLNNISWVGGSIGLGFQKTANLQNNTNIPIYKHFDKVKIVHSVTKQTYIGKIVGTASGHAYYVQVNNLVPGFTCWATADPFNKLHEYKIQNKITRD